MQDKSLLYLKKYFGYDSFRPMQHAAIQALEQGKDVLLLMPTGGGKSLCFQLPALLREGTTLVVSPLIALMKDQVQALRANGISADFLNSSLNAEEITAVKRKCREGSTKLLYLAPETLMLLRDTLLNELKVSLVAIDEAHCISSWGHDFRPEYQQLGFLRKKFEDVPFIALTATADKLTRGDIIAQLKLKEPEVFVSSFDRKNLSIEVRRGLTEAKKISEIFTLIQKHPNDSGIIYCLSRKNTEKVVAKLKALGVNCGYYHAGMNSEERSAAQEAFTNDNIKVMVATVAFGMGIDKSNVRYVIHYNLPKNIESYYQEIGRAGRDGLNSETLLCFSVGDIISLKRFAMDSGKPELSLEKLRQMQELAEARICRRKILLNYFSESMTKDCGNCDVCKNPPKFIEGSIYAQKALSALIRANEKIGFSMLINILRGSKSTELFELGYHHIKTYGQGADLSYEQWQAYLMQMLQLGLMELAYNENYSLKVTPFGMQVVQGKQEIFLVQPEPLVRKTKAALKGAKNDHATASKQSPLFEELRILRKQIADSLGMPPFIVFGDSTLVAMVEKMPVTEQEMLQISGVSDKKMARYGFDFLQVLTNFSGVQPVKRQLPPKEPLTEVQPSKKPLHPEKILTEENLDVYVNEMRLNGVQLSHSKLAKILVAKDTNHFDEKEQSLSFFGLLHEQSKFTTIRAHLLPYFEKHFYSESQKQLDEFFSEPFYNLLDKKSTQRLIAAISYLPLEKPTEGLSEALQALRKTHPRANEPWSEKEIELYRNATEHTNDLHFLSNAFQRSEKSVKSFYATLLKIKNNNLVPS